MKHQMITTTLSKWVKEYNTSIKANKGLTNQFKKK